MSERRFGDQAGMVLSAQTHHPGKAAATATESRPVFVAPVACQILSVSYVLQAAVVGDDTDSANLNLDNKGAAGAGTTELANHDFVTGVDGVAFDEASLYAPTTPLSLSAGDVLALEIEKVGSSGLLIPEMIVNVEYRFT